MAALVFMILGFAVGRVFPVRYKIFNERIQLLCTLVLIFLMGVGLGQRDGFFSGLISLGFTSFLFFLIPTILSIAVVYLLTRWFMDGAGEKSRRDAGGRRRDTKDSDPMVFLALGALLLGIGFGAVPLTAHILKPLSDHTDWLLGLLSRDTAAPCEDPAYPCRDNRRFTGRRYPVRAADALSGQTGCLHRRWLGLVQSGRSIHNQSGRSRGGKYCISEQSDAGDRRLLYDPLYFPTF